MALEQTSLALMCGGVSGSPSEWIAASGRAGTVKEVQKQQQSLDALMF